MIVDIKSKETPLARTWGSVGRWTDGAGRGDDDVFHIEFERGEDDVTGVIVRAVAMIRDRDATEIQPLAEVIDPDMLDSMVEQGSGGSSMGGEFTFQYEGLEITVTTDGHVWIERL